MSRASSSILLLLIFISCPLWAVQWSAIVQANFVKSDELGSFLDKGTGVLRYDDDQFNLSQATLNLKQDLGAEFTLDVVANAYSDGEQRLGLTQSQLLYKPLSPGTVKWRARAGFFYPRMSLENVDVGWLSPFTYTQSAINSWIGEELRTAGLEMTLYSPGRARKSPWSWEFHLAAFKGNDPLATLLSWRGFAMHDRQTLLNERVEFAPYPTVIDRDIIWHPSWVEPFHEIDGRIGYYLGAHLSYYKQSNVRYYFYDNQADPLALNGQRLYGWRTKFHSLAFQHKFNPKTRVISQWLSGSSNMGDRFVYINFDAWYLMLSHREGKHRISARYDHFKVREDDIIPVDQNNSDGEGLTFAWRYDWSKQIQFGFEHHINRNAAANRPSLGEPEEVNQNQTMAVIQFRWQ